MDGQSRKIAALMPYRWKKGQSGNPSGRAKGMSGLIREATNNGKLLIEKALQLLNARQPSIQLETLKFMVERGWGKIVTENESLEGLNNTDIRRMLFIELGKNDNSNGNFKVGSSSVDQLRRQALEIEQSFLHSDEKQGDRSISPESPPT